jgi:outer membrane protein assembly factor BamB
VRPVSRRALLAASMVAPFARVVEVPTRDARAAEAGAVPVYRGNMGRTGENPGPGPLASSPVRWWVRLGEVITSSPVVVDGTIYVGSVAPSTVDGGALHAVDAATGTERWRCGTVPGELKMASPAVANGTVVTGSYDGIILAVSTETGEERWRFQGSGPFFTPSPALLDGTVYLGTAAGHFYAIDVETGEERWRFDAPRPSERRMSTPAAAEGIVYVIDTSGWVDDPTYLHAFDAASGEERWRFEPEPGVYIRRIPILADGLVYVLTREQSVYTLDPFTGEMQSELDLGVSNSCPPALAGGTLYTGTEDGKLVAHSMTSGEREWTIELADGVPIMSSPTVTGAWVYAGDAAGRLYAVDRASGEKRWDRFTACLSSTAAVTGGMLYIGGNNGALVAIGGAEPDAPIDRNDAGADAQALPH